MPIGRRGFSTPATLFTLNREKVTDVSSLIRRIEPDLSELSTEDKDLINDAV